MAAVDRLCAELGAPPYESEVLGWDALRRLAREGVTLASHTRTHPLLTRVPAETVREELRASLEDLEREIGSVPPLFAYPGGRYDEGVVQLVREAGFQAAFTTQRGTNDLGEPGRADRFRLRRINVGPVADCSALRARLLESAPCLNWLRPLPPEA